MSTANIDIKLAQWMLDTNNHHLPLLHITAESQLLEKYGFLTDPRLYNQSWEDIPRIEPENRNGRTTLWSQWWQSPTEEVFTELFPFRTKKDRSIRLARASDWYRIYSHNPPAGYDHILSLGWDYITTLNLLFAIALIPRLYERLSHIGALLGDIEHYVKCTKMLSDRIKIKGLNDEPNPWLYVELATLTGYRNPPYPGFDVIKESHSLADGGNEFTLPLRSFNQHSQQLVVIPRHTEWFTFAEWLGSARWNTSGASSTGRVTVDTPEGQMQFKARKNQLLDLYTVDELVNQALAAKGQENKTILKSELGKIRLAVTSDVWTYFKQAYLMYLVNKSYRQWPGVRVDEPLNERTHRMEQMLNDLRDKFGLPYDFAAFDHQPTTDMIVDIHKRLGQIALMNVPLDHVREITDLITNINEAYYKSTLQTKLEGVELMLSVTGGLMSGLRVTSVVGNAWNKIMTSLAQELAQALHYESADRSDILGDDSSLLYTRWQDASAMNSCYAAIGVKGGVGKFALVDKGTEFLRVRYYQDRCWGYPARALPALVQRKPWSSRPWSDASTLEHWVDTCNTLERRGLDVDRLRRGLIGIWCQLHQVPKTAVSTPRWLGGFGLTVGKVQRYKMRPVPNKNCHIQRKTTERERLITQQLAELYPIAPLPDVVTEAAQEAADSTLTADDLGPFAKQLTKQANKAMKGMTPIADVNMYIPYSIDRILRTADDLDAYEQDCQARLPDFGRFPEIPQVLRDAVYFKEVPHKFLKRWKPEAYNTMKYYARRLGQAAAIDYLSGTMSSPLAELHPGLSRYVLLDSLSTALPHAMSQRQDLRTAVWVVAPTLLAAWRQQPVVRRLFCW